MSINNFGIRIGTDRNTNLSSSTYRSLRSVVEPNFNIDF